MARGKAARIKRRRTRAALGVSKAQDQTALTAGASGSTSLPLSGRNDAWDAGAAQKSLQPGDFANAHFWYIDGKPRDQITSYKFPFARRTDGGLQAVWRGVTAGAARLSSAKGVDAGAIQGKMSPYYAKAAKQYDDPTITPPWKAAAETEEFEVRYVHARLDGDGVTLAPKSDGNDQEPDNDEDDMAPNTGRCANADCNHMAIAHRGSMNDGACSMQGCSCGGFETASAKASLVADVEEALPEEQTLIQSATQNVGVPVGATAFMLLPTTTSPPGVNAATYTLTGYTAVPMTADGAVAPPLPDEHQPGEKMPRRHVSPKAPASTVVPGGALAWQATLAPEGKATDDGRIFAPGSITWRELPLTLMAMTKTADGHDGAEVAGRIDKIWRDEKAGLIRASGVFNAGDFGQKIAGLVGDGTMRGISVDIAPQKVEMKYRDQVVDEDGKWIEGTDEVASTEETDDPTALDLLMGDPSRPIIYVVRDAVLGMATVCPFQAFADATIEPAASLVASGSDMIWTVTQDGGWSLSGESAAIMAALIASAVPEENALTANAAGIAPEAPPAEWFNDPELPELTALTVTEDGRIYGHVAPWGLCHIGLPGNCREAPHSRTDYAYFHLKEVVCEDGTRVQCGTITLDANHADNGMSREGATRHYDHTGTAVADVVCGEDDHGIWIAGALRGNVDEEKARKLRGAALSGDWRSVKGNLELVAVLAVNVPGFPIPRPSMALVASGDHFEIETLVAAGVHMGLTGLTDEEREQFEQLRATVSDEWEEILSIASF